MKLKNLLRNIFFCFTFFAVLFAENGVAPNAYAASLPFYNITANTGENYTGKQVIYTYNGRELPLTYPGILVSGTALADCEELFARELGLQVTISGNTINFTDGITIVQFTLGSKSATINGTAYTMNVAPVQLLFNDTIKYYVPTRFVTEAFGFSYVWVSSTSTVKITKTLNLSINDKNITYNNAFYSVSYDEQMIPTELPILYYNGSIYAPARKIFETAGCIYEESDSDILITRGDISLALKLNNTTAFVNNKKIIMGVAPVKITDVSKGTSYTYIPLEFASEMLGFKLDYQEKRHCYVLNETEATGKSAQQPWLNNYIGIDSSETVIPLFDTSNRTSCFEWTEQESFEKQENHTYLTKVCGYSLDNNVNVLELYGVTKRDITDFMDSGQLILELPSILTNIDIQYYPYAENSTLVHSILVGLSDNTKIMVMSATAIQWFFVENTECVQVYIVAADVPVESMFYVYTGNFTDSLTNTYPDDKLIVPLPEEIESAHIQDRDNYLEKNFEIKVSGNHEEFYQNNIIQNPYYLIKDYMVSYDYMTDTTTVKFFTKAICGYKYSVKKGYLEITVARPSDLYSKIVVLDAGHGGTDPGASKGGYNEKDINFKILNTYTKTIFEDSDIKIYFTRETDVLIDLYDRAAFASEVGADMFLSLHMNANNSGSVSGTEIFYSSYNNTAAESGLTSTRLAKALADNISSAMGTKNRGVSNSEFVVVKYNTVPAVLIELGFMTNKSELAKLTDSAYQIKAAGAIYWSVIEMFELFPTGR